MKPTLGQLFAQKAPILYDGATGTLLQSLGLPIGTPPEKWVLENPASIYAAAEAYVNAGSQVILTCTFGASAFRLRDCGLEGQADEVNHHAVELACRAAAGRALVAGSIGPLGGLVLTLGTLMYDQAVEEFAHQANWLAEGGVDLLQIESMSDLQEVDAAIQGVRSVTNLPLVVSFSFETKRKTLVGVSPSLAVRHVSRYDVTAIGANCGRGPDDMADILREMHAFAPNMPLLAKPNAGLPTLVGDQAVYAVDPKFFASYAREWVDAGAKMIGGCCGTTPAHIQELRIQTTERR